MRTEQPPPPALFSSSTTPHPPTPTSPLAPQKNKQSLTPVERATLGAVKGALFGGYITAAVMAHEFYRTWPEADERTLAHLTQLPVLGSGMASYVDLFLSSHQPTIPTFQFTACIVLTTTILGMIASTVHHVAKATFSKPHHI